MNKGGKAESLMKLKKADFNVPVFFICDPFENEKNILSKKTRFLPRVEYFAVRSSAKNEDSKKESMAGYYYSAVGVSGKDIFKEFLKVKNSFNKESGSVIIQEFIPSDKAGVIFSQIGDNNIVINSNIGLCQTVVNGHACDEYICDATGKIINKNIPKEKEVQVFEDGNIVHEKRFTESLNIHEIRQLVSVAMKIQKLFKAPQDIEWCFRGDVLYILQSRPITRNFEPINEEYFFDSANIAESYSGVVLPLTYSYAQFVYEKAYKDLLIMSGVSKRRIEDNSYIFENLLGYFYGRMYYNMNNWYRMASFVPGYRRNKHNLESMITSNVKEEISTSIKPSFWLKIFYPSIVVAKVIFYGITARFFKFSVGNKINNFQSYDFDGLTYEGCKNLFDRLTREMLHRWYVTLENDFFVMTYSGLLKKIITPEKLQEIMIFKSTATQQVAAIADLSSKMQNDKDLWSAVLANNAKKFDARVSENIEVERALNKYFKKFGGRFANELKLESIGIDEDIKKLFPVLKAYKNYKIEERKLDSININAPFYKKILIFFILKKFNKYASQREEFRLLRSSAFGIVRKIFRRMGALLADKCIIGDSDDIFYLSMKEVFELNLENNPLISLIRKRKQEYLSYKKISTPVHFSSKDDIAIKEADKKIIKKNHIKANPASNGTSKGRIKIFKDFFMPDSIDFDILVASHTDPGWTPLIALSKGMIIEHGGVLSHASIVARELNIPAVIGATGIMDQLKDGQIVEINGSTGFIKIIC
ncbi:MAG: PEP/pyruvate-binding domain-containing protein [Candidatus Pacebacteria bacterium]|nr:PEP/pyruvate-binding domain-containing protein [Candidatus Paceibacterota bacterium]